MDPDQLKERMEILEKVWADVGRRHQEAKRLAIESQPIVEDPAETFADAWARKIESDGRYQER